MRPFRGLLVWEVAHKLVLDVYKVTAGFPREELFALTSQIRRSAASVPANLAEGRGRTGDVEMARFTRIAMGSASELEYHLLLAHDLNYLLDADYKRLSAGVVEVKKMLTGFLDSLTTTDGAPNKARLSAPKRQ